MNEKIKYIIILIAIGIVGAAFYFYAYPVPIPTNTQDSGENTNVPTQYVNTQYGFSVSLPITWTGYSTIADTWQGYSLVNNGNTQQITETGPLIYVRHPAWTTENPRMDIPVMVFTLTQWNDMQADKFHIGAAPINPSELARNATYVFALPARYNFSYLTGYEEVDQIIQGGGVKSL